MILSASSKRGLAAHFGIGARPQAIGQLDAELDLHFGARHLQRLQVGVGHHKIDAFQIGVDHAVDGIAAAATHADYLDLGVIARILIELNADIVRHVFPGYTTSNFDF